VWREQARSRLADLRTELDGLPTSQQSDTRYKDARRRLSEAAKVLDRRPSLHGVWSGADIEGTWMRIHAIEVALVRLSAPESVKAKLPCIIDDGSQLLGEDHPRVKALQTYAERTQWSEHDRESIAQSVRTIHDASDKENVRLRSFRNILIGAVVALAILAIGFGVIGAVFPSALSLSSNTSSPLRGGSHAGSRTDILVIEMLGLVSASLVGALAIRRIHGTSTSYGVPMASLLLKLPTGALTAVAGLLMMRAGIAGPALTAASDSNLVAYALLFGASQQGVTGLVDRQAQAVLNSVSSKDNA
jgi:hypothetical protein